MTQAFDKTLALSSIHRPNAVWLLRIIYIAIVSTTMHGLLMLVVVDSPLVPVGMDIGFLAALLISYGLHRVGQIQLVQLSISLSLWLYITIGLILMGGMDNPLVEAYITFVLIVTLLYSRPQTSLYALLIGVLSLVFIVFIDSKSWLPPSAIELNQTYIWLSIIFNLFSIGALTYILLRLTQASFENTLQETQARAQRREQMLEALQSITIELTSCDTLDDLLKQAVLLGREKLEIDRIGIFLFDEDTQTVIGTYGTDESGNLRDERQIFRPLADAGIVSTLMDRQHSIHISHDIALLDEWEVVGYGWNTVITLWDSEKVLGWFSCDNLITQKPLSNLTIDVITTYASNLSQIMVRKQAETLLRQSSQALTTRSELLKAINKLAETLHRSQDTQELLEKTADTLLALLKAYSVLIYLHDDSKEKLVLEYSKNAVLSPVTELVIEATLSGDAMRQKRVIITDNFTSEERLSVETRQHLRESIIQYLVIIPIIFGDRSLGVINLGFTIDLHAENTDYQTFAAIGQTVGLALTNARVIQDVQLEKDFSDSIIESIPNIFFMFSEAGKLVRWNANFESLIGETAEHLTNLSPLALVWDFDHANIESLFQKTLETGSGNAYLHLQTNAIDSLPYILSTRRYEMYGQRYIIGTGVDLSDRMKLLEQLQYQTQQLQTAGDISKSLVAMLNTSELMQHSVNIICEQFELYYVGIFLLDKQNEFAVLNAGSGNAGREMLSLDYRLPLDKQSMIGSSIIDKRPVIAADVTLQEGHHANPHLPETKSEMALPLMNRGDCLGAMTIQSVTYDAFTNDDIAIMNFIADHLSSAIINAQLYNVIDRRQRYLSTLTHVTQRALPERNLKLFMQTTVETLAKEFQYEFASIFVVDHSEDALLVGAYSDYVDRNLDDRKWSIDHGILGWVIRNRRAYLCEDSTKDPYYIPPPNLEHIPRSVVAAPIMSYDKVIALLVVRQSGANILNELDLEIMSELALEVGLQMENIRLYAQTQQNAEELEARVDARTSQLQNVNSELESFAYSVSHDLRAPLRSIDGFSQALLEDYHDALDSGGQMFLSRIRAASQRMGHLIDDLLTLSRVTRREFRHQDVDLSQMAEDIIEELRSQDREREANIIIQAGMEVSGDARMLRIVLENLLGNAWKFTSHTAKTEIQFTQKDMNDETVYRIRDNGVGFNMEYVDKLFKAFQRLHAMNEFEGTGIGLATVKRVIDRHGGRIWVQAEEGKGATFYFTIGEIIESNTADIE